MRLPSIALVAFTVALTAAFAGAGTATGHPALGEPATGPVIASATGSGQFHIGTELRTFAFTARQYADGTSAGQAQLFNRSQTFGPIHMKLDCLRVLANTATMSGVVTSVGTPSPPFSVGSHVRFTVMDNGEGQAPPDMISLVFFYGTFPVSCNTGAEAPTNQVEHGNVQVHG